ncbi:hypothetical protein CEXT_68141 [Caerostris extrusa]|uniref:Uncharacterized protein n=1 Tax=Caerostris extrusa TaxID=172846 RepID=A0AAV4VS53_CAEEX|nr:hypothetical protein CEXT_68141 [Caerostris extrusa]
MPIDCCPNPKASCPPIAIATLECHSTHFRPMAIPRTPAPPRRPVLKVGALSRCPTLSSLVTTAPHWINNSSLSSGISSNKVALSSFLPIPHLLYSFFLLKVLMVLKVLFSFLLIFKSMDTNYL